MTPKPTYDLEDARKQWSSPPFDDVGYIPSNTYLSKTKDEILQFVKQFEETRYNLNGWRNTDNKWRAYLGLDDTKNKHVLDYGSGLGIESLQFLKSGNKVSIADISKDNLDAAEHIIKNCGFEIENKIFIKEESPFFETEKIDVFYSNDVLNHTPQIREILQRVHEILKDDGEVRLMLYSDKAWTLNTKSDLPDITEDVATNIHFEKFVKSMDGVGKYADWYNKEKIEYITRGLFVVNFYEYICTNDIYCVAKLTKR